MNDMSRVIVPKSDQLNSDDLIAGPITITITDVKISGGAEQPVAISFDGDEGKPWKPCKSMSRVLVAAWGADAKKYVGRSATLYRDPTVKWAGMEVGGIRVSHLSDIDKTMVMALTATKGSRKPFTVKPLTGRPQKPSSPVPLMLKEIAACADRTTLRAWWGANNEAIPEDDYAQVLGVFNARLAAVPKTAPAAQAPQEDDGAAAVASQPASQPERRDESEMGETPTLDQAKAALDGCKSEDAVQTMLDSFRGQLSDEDLVAASIHANGIVAERWAL